MSADKNKIALYAFLGVWGVCALGLAYWLYDAASSRAEAEEERDDADSALRRFYSAPVFPGDRQIQAVKSNAMEYAVWYDSAAALANRGDKTFPQETAPVFKQRLQAKVRELAQLPGAAEGRIASEKFLFGFDQYLGESDQLPQAQDVPRLQAQLDFVAHFAETLAEAGAMQLQELVRLPQVASNRLDYAVKFTAKPPALVKTLNLLAADTRFITVTNMAFAVVNDPIAARFSSAEGKGAGSGEGSSRRRRRRAAAAEAEEKKESADKKADRIVTDPERNAEFSVNMTVAVYDFGTAKKEEAK